MAKAVVKKPSTLKLPVDWILSGGNHKRYDFGIDAEIRHDDKIVFLLKNKDEIAKAFEFSSAETSKAPNAYLGARVELTMWLKTEAVTWVMPWMSVKTEIKLAAMDNACERKISGTTGWQKWSIVLDVSADATAIEYGVWLGGKGKVWFTEPELSIVPADCSTTDCACMVNQQKKSKLATSKKRSTIPGGWAQRVVYRSAADYVIGIDSEVSFGEKPAAFIEIKKAAVWESVELYQYMSCNGYQGKRIRFDVQLKSLDVKTANFFVDVIGPHEGTVALDDMNNRKLVGTNDWAPASLVLDVPDSAVELKFGARVTGGGTIWFSDLCFDEVEKSVAVTDDYSSGCRGIWWNQLINTDFSEKEEKRYLGQSSKPGSVAKGWLGWSEPDGAFEVGIDSTCKRGGKNSGCVKFIGTSKQSQTAGLFQKFDAKIYRGKRVRFTAFVKTAGSSEKCGLALCVMDARQLNLFSQNTFDVDSNAEHDWLKREIVVDVPGDAGVFMLSLDVTGGGSAWINEPAMEVVERDVPLTISSYKAKPLNLKLTE